jgi:hypothetical protein
MIGDSNDPEIIAAKIPSKKPAGRDEEEVETSMLNHDQS